MMMELSHATVIENGNVIVIWRKFKHINLYQYTYIYICIILYSHTYANWSFNNKNSGYWHKEVKLKITEAISYRFYSVLHVHSHTSYMYYQIEWDLNLYRMYVALYENMYMYHTIDVYQWLHVKTIWNDIENAFTIKVNSRKW